MGILLSGLIGALIASLLAIFYQLISLKAKKRFEIMLSVVNYCDELNYNSRNLEQLFKRGLVNSDEYKQLSNKTDLLLTSSKVKALIALTYGENSRELDKFDELHQELFNAALVLFRAKQGKEAETSELIREKFENVIDPLRHILEIELLRGSSFWSVLIYYIRGLMNKRESWLKWISFFSGALILVMFLFSISDLTKESSDIPFFIIGIVVPAIMAALIGLFGKFWFLLIFGTWFMSLGTIMSHDQIGYYPNAIIIAAIILFFSPFINMKIKKQK